MSVRSVILWYHQEAKEKSFWFPLNDMIQEGVRHCRAFSYAIKQARIEGGEVANNENLVPFTSNQSREEAVRNGKKGGIKSGEARRRKANFRKTLNMLLTGEIDSKEYGPILEALGVDSTLESAMMMSMIKAALEGNVKAAYFVAQYAGQSPEPDENRENREADTELKRARKQAVTGENETEKALDKLDSILKEMRDNAVKQEAE